MLQPIHNKISENRLLLGENLVSPKPLPHNPRTLRHAVFNFVFHNWFLINYRKQLKSTSQNYMHSNIPQHLLASTQSLL
tara:strand:+ start:514 stop:750 length:237 start_codon:yes stop_codon:yes gene_type:complete